MTFAELKMKYPEYLDWAIKVWMKDRTQACPGMDRLVRWAENLGPDEDPAPGTSSGSSSRPASRNLGTAPKAKVKAKAAAAPEIKREVVTPPRNRPTAVKSKPRMPQRYRMDHEDWMAVETPAEDLSVPEGDDI